MDSIDFAIAAVVILGIAFAFQQLYLHASYQMHKLQKMDASAAETQAVETGQPTIAQK